MPSTCRFLSSRNFKSLLPNPEVWTLGIRVFVCLLRFWGNLQRWPNYLEKRRLGYSCKFTLIVDPFETFRIKKFEPGLFNCKSWARPWTEAYYSVIFCTEACGLLDWRPGVPSVYVCWWCEFFPLFFLSLKTVVMWNSIGEIGAKWRMRWKVIFYCVFFF